MAEKQAFITLAPEETAGVQVEAGGRITVDYSGDVKTFRMQAAFCDRNGEENAAFEKVKLAWSSSDKKVATVKASKDTHSAEIKIVGDGHTILTAKVKDKAGHTATAQIEIRNRAPRVNVSKVTVNPHMTSTARKESGLPVKAAGRWRSCLLTEQRNLIRSDFGRAIKRHWRPIWNCLPMRKAGNTVI